MPHSPDGFLPQDVSLREYTAGSRKTRAVWAPQPLSCTQVSPSCHTKIPSMVEETMQGSTRKQEVRTPRGQVRVHPTCSPQLPHSHSHASEAGTLSD